MPNILRASGKPASMVAAALALAILAALAIELGSTSPGASAAAAIRRDPSPPSSVGAVLIERPAGALRWGTVVRSATLGQRVFPDARHGFALADVGGGQYPATTSDGGTTWRVDGPPLHVNAAQAPLVVLQVGAANRHTFFAWGGPGGGQSVDVTSDAGKHWFRALLGDVVMAVVADPNGRLVAFAQVATGSTGATAATWVYVSRDGGRHWHYSTSLAAI